MFKVERTVCVFLSVTVLPACVRVLDSTDVAFTTEVLRMGDGVKVAPSLPARTSVEVLMTVGTVVLIVAICLSMILLVVYTVTREIDVDEEILDEEVRAVEEARVEEALAATHVWDEPWPTTKG